jgi:hypothetical protein
MLVFEKTSISADVALNYKHSTLVFFEILWICFQLQTYKI